MVARCTRKSAQISIGLDGGYYGVGIEKVLDTLPPLEVPTVLHFAGEDRFVSRAA